MDRVRVGEPLYLQPTHILLIIFVPKTDVCPIKTSPIELTTLKLGTQGSIGCGLVLHP